MIRARLSDICVLPGGERCDDWAFMRKECPCGERPQLAPPAPGFCEGGTIVPGTRNACGCQSPPSCQK